MYKYFNKSWLRHLSYILADFLSLQFSFFIAYIIRFGFTLQYMSSYLQLIVLLTIICAFIPLVTSNYETINKRGYLVEFKFVLKYVFVAIFTTVIVLFIAKQSEAYSRMFLLLLTIISIASVYTTRTIIKILRNKYHLSIEERAEMLVLCKKNEALDILYTVREHCGDGVITGFVIIDEDMQNELIGGIKVVGNVDNFTERIKSMVIDEIFLPCNDMPYVPSESINLCINMGITIHYSLSRVDDYSSNKTFEQVNGYVVLTSSIKFVSVGQLFVKRLFDIIFGFVGVVMVGVVYIFVAPIIYIKSPGPIFFSQTRVGKNGRRFKIYKFRSMYMDAEKRKKELMEQNKIADGMMFKMDNDPRIIKGIGNFIRDYSVDELPQLLNVLKGDMSLVGTRPPTIDEFIKYDYHHRARLATKPGITGLWQVSGRSNITDFEEVVKLDVSYITNWNIWLDIKILFKTVKVVLTKSGAS